MPRPPAQSGRAPSTLQLAKELRSTRDRLQRHHESQLVEFHELLGLMHQQLSQLDTVLSSQDSSSPTLLEPQTQTDLKGSWPQTRELARQGESSQSATAMETKLASNSTTPAHAHKRRSSERKPSKDKVNLHELKHVSEKITEVFEHGPHVLNGIQVADVESLFKALDRDGAGELDKHEIVGGLKQMGAGLSNHDVEVLLTALDKDGNGLIEPHEFEEALHAYEIIDDELVRNSSVLSLGSEGVLAKLKSSLELSEKAGDTEQPKLFRSRSRRFVQFRQWKKKEKDTALDMVMAFIIVANAVTIGISMDYNFVALQIFDLLFTFSFLCELAAKIWLHGMREQFASMFNCLDFFLILADLTQLVLNTFVNSADMEGAPSASLFRVVRLVRLVRLLRILRLDMFDDLISMVGGMIGGMSTLLWAVVLFLMIVYVTSLLFREFFGNNGAKIVSALDGDVDLTELFSSIPRSMLTVFRCFFGDCNTMDGIALFEMIQISYGTPSTVFLGTIFFFVVVGLFNVISAIFVESTIAAAQALQKARKTERQNDFQLWSTRVSILVKLLYEYNGTDVGATLSESLTDLATVPVAESTFSEWLKDERVRFALGDLEILEEDHRYLFDILDNDNTGSIFVSQLVDGLQRLRGDPRRSDIITVDLMLRAIQSQTTLLVAGMENALDRLSVIVQATKETV